MNPYAAQLQRGFHALRFEPLLEQDFQGEAGYARRLRVRLGCGLAAAFWLFATVAWIKPELAAIGTVAGWLRAGALAALLLVFALSWADRWSWLRRLRPWAALTACVALAAVVTTLEALSRRNGLTPHREVLLLLALFAGLFSGLSFRLVLGATVAVPLGWAVAAWAVGLPFASWGPSLLVSVLGALAAVTTAYAFEQFERETFLRRGLLGVAATRDNLTGLLNRAAFMHQCERGLRQAAREGVVVGVVLIDLDFFKPYNDRYGHLAGDACLRAAAEALRDEFRRPLDALGRYGGEEFIGIWYDVQAQSLQAQADQLRATVQGLAIENRDAPGGRVTASVGVVATRPTEDESLGALVKRADAALYEAKEKGRNRAVVEVMAAARTRGERRGRRAPTLTPEG